MLALRWLKVSGVVDNTSGVIQHVAKYVTLQLIVNCFMCTEGVTWASLGLHHRRHHRLHS